MRARRGGAPPVGLRVYADSVTDEPRRSGRATKGQYTKDRDILEDVPSKKKGKGKGGKAKAADQEEEEGEEEEGGDEIIRCVCGTYEEEEDVPRAMICCDKCSAWQHNSCMGLPEDYEVDTYFCEQCKPENHKPLLQAIARGEKPWEEAAAKQRAAAKAAKKKGGKKGRKSGGPRTSEVTSHASPEAEDPTPQAPATGQKRKLEESASVPEPKVCYQFRRSKGIWLTFATEQKGSRNPCYRNEWRKSCDPGPEAQSVRDSLPTGIEVRVGIGAGAGCCARPEGALEQRKKACCVDLGQTHRTTN